LTWRRMALAMLAGGLLCVPAVVPAAAAPGPGLSLTGFAGVPFGTGRAETRRRLSRRGFRLIRCSGGYRLRRPVLLLGIKFRVILEFSRGRLAEVTYVPRVRCRARPFRLLVEAQTGAPADVLPSPGAGLPDSSMWAIVRKRQVIAVTISHLRGRLLDLSVADQTDQQVRQALPLDKPGPVG
jgi:hypothetical protein